jgi:hypothetical protein
LGTTFGLGGGVLAAGFVGPLLFILVAIEVSRGEIAVRPSA